MRPPYKVLVFWFSILGIILAIILRGRYDGVAFLFTMTAVVALAMVMHEIEDKGKNK